MNELKNIVFLFCFIICYLLNCLIFLCSNIVINFKILRIRLILREFLIFLGEKFNRYVYD